MRTPKRSLLLGTMASAVVMLAAAARGRPAGGGRTYVHVTNAGADTVSVVDRVLNSAVATVPVGDNPRGIGRTPNGKLLYVANRSSPGSVSLHDAIGLHRADFVL